jgi:hypothetical protein
MVGAKISEISARAYGKRAAADTHGPDTKNPIRLAPDGVL